MPQPSPGRAPPLRLGGVGVADGLDANSRQSVDFPGRTLFFFATSVPRREIQRHVRPYPPSINGYPEIRMSPAQALYDTLVHPSRAMPAVAESGRFLPALVAATAAAVLFAALAVPRFDFAKAAAEALDRRPDAAQMTPHQREEAVATANKIGAVAGYASAVLLPTLMALGAAVALWLGFKLAGGAPAFRPALAVASFAQLPSAVHQLLLLPAVLRSEAIEPNLVPRLLPSNAAALLPAGATGPAASFLLAIDLFSLWTVALMVLGMASAARVSRGRAVVTTVLLWLAWVAVFRVALPELGGAR